MSQETTSHIEPNLRVFSDEEIREILDKIGECVLNDNDEEADRLIDILPLKPSTADYLKKDIGIQAMIEEGCNLSEAVREFGHEWLYS